MNNTFGTYFDSLRHIKLYWNSKRPLHYEITIQITLSTRQSSSSARTPQQQRKLSVKVKSFWTKIYFYIFAVLFSAAECRAVVPVETRLARHRIFIGHRLFALWEHWQYCGSILWADMVHWMATNIQLNIFFYLFKRCNFKLKH